MEKMGFSQPDATVDEKGVEFCLAGGFGDGACRTRRKTVAGSDDEVLEGVERIETAEIVPVAGGKGRINAGLIAGGGWGAVCRGVQCEGDIDDRSVELTGKGEDGALVVLFEEIGYELIMSAEGEDGGIGRLQWNQRAKPCLVAM
jgi:hypothetical protein